MATLWDQVWGELRDSLVKQPRCPQHPKFPCVHTWGHDVINDIIEVEEDRIVVRSHRTMKDDPIGVGAFRSWWNHLQEKRSATLDPGGPNTPGTNRPVLIGAIFACCLSARVARIGEREIGLIPPAHEPADYPLPEELSATMQFLEGATRQIVINAYERSPKARRQCIEQHGCNCCVCGFSFGAVYGPQAEGYIHVHHLRPLSEVGGEYVVDPVADLLPVCPNCHAFLHLGGRCRSVDSVVELLEQQRAVKDGKGRTAESSSGQK
jgi:hypothetical protein